MIVIDSFLHAETFRQLKNYSLSQNCIFEDVENPIDSVKYPHICKDIPKDVKERVLVSLCEIFNKEIEIHAIFMRRSPDGCHVPHIAHTDNSMGAYSLMLYMNDREDAGTAFIRHKETGIMYAPESQEIVELVQKDQNDPEKWAVVDMAHMKENRAVIFDAGKFHCAMPIGGFGEGAEARTVLTVFFS